MRETGNPSLLHPVLRPLWFSPQPTVREVRLRLSRKGKDKAEAEADLEGWV